MQKSGTPDEAKISGGLEVSRRYLDAMSSIRGNHKWLAGPNVSLADFYAYAMITLFHLAPEGVSFLGDYPSLADWHVRCSEPNSAKATHQPLETKENE